MQDTAPPKRRRFQYSLRTLLLVQVVIAIVLSIISTGVWLWARLPPSSHCSWANVVDMPSINAMTGVSSWKPASVPKFIFGGFSSYHRPTEIGYLVRIADSRQLKSPTPWLSNNSGLISINGRLFLPQGEKLLLIVADGGQNPRCVVLDPRDSATFRSFEHRGVGYPNGHQHIPKFWNDVLRKKYLPDLTEQH